MASQPQKTLFTIDEAEAMLPTLKQNAFRINQLRLMIRQKLEALNAVDIQPSFDNLELSLESDNDHVVDALSTIKAGLATIRNSVDGIQEHGCRVHDIDTLTVTWPAQVMGKTILLSWQQGDDTINHYCSPTNLSQRLPLSNLVLGMGGQAIGSASLEAETTPS